MKLTFIALALTLSSLALANRPAVGERSETSGTSHHCCPTGTCADKTLPLCAAVEQGRIAKEVGSSNARGDRRKKTKVRGQ